MKYIGHLILAIVGPAIVAALFLVLAQLFHAHNSLQYILYAGEIIGALLIMFWFRKTMGISLAVFGLRVTYAWSYLIWSILYLVVRIAAWVVIIPQMKIQTNWLFLLGQACFFLLFNAMGEELHFRGILFTTMKNMKFRNSVLLAALVSSAVFAFFHLADLLSAGWLWFLPLMADGLALCAFRIKTKSIFWSVLVHGISNICTGALFVGAHSVDDSVVYAYIATVLVIDLLFFTFIFMQSSQQMQENVCREERQEDNVVDTTLGAPVSEVF